MRKRPITLDTALLFVLAATLPFQVLGVPLNEAFVLALSPVVGFAFAVLRVARVRAATACT